MKKRFLKILLVGLWLLSLGGFFFDSCQAVDTSIDISRITVDGGPKTSCEDITWENVTDLSVTNLVCYFKKLYALFALALPGIVVVFMVFWSGFLYITSQGNPAKIKKAGDTFIWAFIGLAIVALAAVIVHFTGKMIGVDYGI